MAKAGIVGVDGDGGVAQHRFGPRCRKPDRFVAPFDGIAKGPEAALYRVVINLIISDGGLELRIPVHQPLAAIDEAVAEKIEKRLPDSSNASRIQREPGTIPVAATPEFAKLSKDARLILIL